MQKTVKDVDLKELQALRDAREMQLQKMAEILGDLTVKLSNVSPKIFSGQILIILFSDKVVESNQNFKTNNKDLKERINFKVSYRLF